MVETKRKSSLHKVLLPLLSFFSASARAHFTKCSCGSGLVTEKF